MNLTTKTLIRWALPLFLTAGLWACGQNPDPPKIEGAIDVAQEQGRQSAPVDEGSATKVAPPLSDEALAEGSRNELDDHPTLAQQTPSVQREIIIPKTVEGKWKAVKILIRDKTDDEKTKIETVSLGSSFTLTGSGLQVEVGSFFPNFVMTDSSITSLDNTLGNPAVHLVVTENGKELYRGWTFKNYPTLYAFEHERFGLQLMGSVPAPVS